MGIEIICGKDMEPGEPKSFRKATSPGEEVDAASALPTLS